MNKQHKALAEDRSVNPMNEKQKPSIRFKGFTEEWEERKLGDIAENFEYGLNAAAKEFDGVNKYIRITDIDDEFHNFNKDDLTSPDFNLEIADRYKLEEGDVLFARTGASVGKSYIYRESDGLVYYAGFLIRGKIKQGFDVEFVFQNTFTENYENYIRITSQRSGQPGVNAQEYREYTFKAPNYAEQKQIGEYFHHLDHLITLHQRKYRKLLNVKKAMLEKMFPRDGKNVPEIRFTGFTEDWEEHKLGDITTSYSGGTPTVGKNEYYNGTIPFIRSGEIEDENTELFLSENGLNHSSAAMVNAGDILYALYGATSGEVSRSKITGAINQAVLAICPNQGYDTEYLMQWLRLNKKTIVDTYLQGGQGNLSGTIVKSLVLKVPSYEEQLKIGQYFANLDCLITLYQRKIEKLQNIKKAILEKMFV